MLSLSQHFSCVRELQYRIKLQLQCVICFIFFIQKNLQLFLIRGRARTLISPSSKAVHLWDCARVARLLACGLLRVSH